MPNFSQIRQFLKFPGCPKVLGQTHRYTDTQILSDSSSTEVENMNFCSKVQNPKRTVSTILPTFPDQVLYSIDIDPDAH